MGKRENYLWVAGFGLALLALALSLPASAAPELALLSGGLGLLLILGGLCGFLFAREPPSREDIYHGVMQMFQEAQAIAFPKMTDKDEAIELAEAVRDLGRECITNPTVLNQLDAAVSNTKNRARSPDVRDARDAVGPCMEKLRWLTGTTALEPKDINVEFRPTTFEAWRDEHDRIP